MLQHMFNDAAAVLGVLAVLLSMLSAACRRSVPVMIRVQSGCGSCPLSRLRTSADHRLNCKHHVAGSGHDADQQPPWSAVLSGSCPAPSSSTLRTMTKYLLSAARRCTSTYPNAQQQPQRILYARIAAWSPQQTLSIRDSATGSNCRARNMTA